MESEESESVQESLLNKSMCCLRKLDGSLRTQLELPRQPSEGCSVGALGPGEHGDRLWSRRRGSNTIKIDGWPLPGPCGPTLSARHFWTHFGSLLGIQFGTHFCFISEAVSGPILELIWSVESIPESSKKERSTESLELLFPTWKASVALPLR